MRIDQLQKCFQPQFIWDPKGKKVLQTAEEYEGSRDLARMIFVGFADMYGIDSVDVCDFLEMEYESHRNKLYKFKEMWREATASEYKSPSVQKFYNKVRLVQNAISFANFSNPYIKLENWISYE